MPIQDEHQLAEGILLRQHDSLDLQVGQLQLILTDPVVDRV